MKNLYLIAIALAAGWLPGDVSAQRVIEVDYKYLTSSISHYGDADGDGVLERIGRFGKVYSYPEGSIPDPDDASRYFLPLGDDTYYRVVDGVAYYRVLPPDPTTMMGSYYPSDRQPDFSEGGYDFFRITSWDDAKLWLGDAYRDPELKNYLFHDGILWWRSDSFRATASTDERLTWMKPDGSLIYIDGTENAILVSSTFLIADFNADGRADVLYAIYDPSTSGGNYSSDGVGWAVAYSDASGASGAYRIQPLDGISKDYSMANAVVTDFNRDGRKDIFLFHSAGWAKAYEPFTLLQLADGTFTVQPLNVVTDPAEIAQAQFSDGGNGSFTNNSVNMSGMAGGEHGVSYAEAARMEAVDINMDGYPDLIDPEGNTLLSLPDGRYYSASIAGGVTVADFNGDGVKDLVVFDKNSGDVTLNLSQGAAGFEPTVLFSNNNVTDVICRDLDGDRLSDILLLANTPRGQQYAYLVFFKNRGDGTFQKTERAISGTREFYGVYDFSMDGRPTAIASDGSQQFFRIDWDASFNITEASLMPSGYDANYYDNLTFHPYLGDGYMYIAATDENAGYLDDARLVSLTPAATENTPPAKLGAPRVIVDGSTANVKVEWGAGSDSESATEDLDYEVRLGGGSALYQSLTGGNTFVVANAGSWPEGEVRAQVRAIDQNGLAGQWSDAAEFENAAVSAPFALSATQLGLADTLVATALGGYDVSFRALPDGEVIASDGRSARILFADMGQKTIEATVSGSGITVAQKVSVSPLRTDDAATGGWPVDLDADGQVELISGEDLYKYDSGSYEEYPSLSLSDVRIGPDVILDKNMDGKPDIYGGHYKGGDKFNWLINNGSMDFTLDSEGFTSASGGSLGTAFSSEDACDFNNDGFPDFYTGARLFKNYGDGRLETIEQKFDNGQWGAYIVPADFNRDGLMDYLLLGDGNDYNSSFKRQYFLAINRGNFSFERVELPMLEGATPHTVKAIDVDGDGWTDIAYSYGGYDSYEYSARLGGSDLKFEQEVELPGLPLGFDFDNDGRMDYAATADSLVLNRTGGPQTAHISGLGKYSNLSTIDPLGMFDLYNDGYPDGWNSIGELSSRYPNTAPTAPAQVYVTQNQDNITLNWSGATDAESPSAYLRYNVSVREKGTDNYIISPLNSTSDIAATPSPGWLAYRTTPTMPIPFGRFTAGKAYEVRIQTIDPWFAHSAFSEPVEFTPAEVGLITMPVKGGVGVPVEFEYRDNVEGQFAVSADGGTVNGNTITWNTPGLKTVTVTISTLRSEHKIMIVERPNLDIELPGKALAGTVLTVALPEAFASTEGKASISIDGGSADIDALGTTATLTLPKSDGWADVRLTYEDGLFGKIEAKASIEVVGAAFRPEITMVSVEGGHNVVNWDASMQLPESSIFNGTVNVYRETALAGEYEKVAEVPLADGRFADTESYPDVKTTRYMLTMNTSYGCESLPGRVHGNVHVMINRGLGNDINLHWMPYEGAEIAQYTILAGTSADKLTVLDELSGNSQSFTHKRTDDTPMYYSLAYTFKPEPTIEAVTQQRAPVAAGEGRSNVVSTAEAYSVTMLQALQITSREGIMELGQTQPVLHLMAVATPALATITTVEWSIVDGGKLADISPDGILTVKENATGGTVRVQAKAVDGSGVTALADVQAGIYNGITDTACSAHDISISVKGHAVVIDNLPTDTDVLVADVAGRVEYRACASGSLSITSLSPGLHIVRAGNNVAKVVVR